MKGHSRQEEVALPRARPDGVLILLEVLQNEKVDVGLKVQDEVGIAVQKMILKWVWGPFDMLG